MREVRRIAVLAALFLAACAEPARERRPVAEPLLPRLLPPATAGPAEPAPLAEAQPAAVVPVFEPTVEATVELDVARLTPAVNDDPAQVMGLDRPALEALLGAPGFLREEADAQVWQYRQGDCFLDVYLYSDGLAAPYRVRYFELRGVAATDAARRDCFRGLLAAKEEG